MIIDGNQLNEVRIAQLVAGGDALIAFTHFKGHPMGVIGGCLKNLGIGAASAHGKWLDHYMRGQVAWSTHVPMIVDVDPFACVGKAACPVIAGPWADQMGTCEWTCPYNAFDVDDNGMTRWDPSICNSSRCQDMTALCGNLQSAGCPAGFGLTNPALGFSPDSIITKAEANVNCAIRYTDTAIGSTWCYPEGKFANISVAREIQPWCDCVSGDGLPLVPEIGVLGALDPVAPDVAFLDLAKALPSYPGSMADILGLGPGDEKFGPVNIGDPYIQCEAGERIGGGSTNYNLIEVTPVWRGLWADDPYYLHDQVTKLRDYFQGPEKHQNDPRALYFRGDYP
jgi:hypothetical protein